MSQSDKAADLLMGRTIDESFAETIDTLKWHAQKVLAAQHEVLRSLSLVIDGDSLLSGVGKLEKLWALRNEEEAGDTEGDFAMVEEE